MSLRRRPVVTFGMRIAVASLTIRADAPARYVTSPGTVLDTTTQLTWQQPISPGS